MSIKQLNDTMARVQEHLQLLEKQLLSMQAEAERERQHTQQLLRAIRERTREEPSAFECALQDISEATSRGQIQDVLVRLCGAEEIPLDGSASWNEMAERYPEQLAEAVRMASERWKAL